MSRPDDLKRRAYESVKQSLQSPRVWGVLSGSRLQRGAQRAFEMNEAARAWIDDRVEAEITTRGLEERDGRLGAAARWIVDQIRRRRELWHPEQVSGPADETPAPPPAEAPPAAAAPEAEPAPPVAAKPARSRAKKAAAAPEAEAPEAQAPQAEAPEVQAPEAEAPEAEASKPKAKRSRAKKAAASADEAEPSPKGRAKRTRSKKTEDAEQQLSLADEGKDADKDSSDLEG